MTRKPQHWAEIELREWLNQIRESETAARRSFSGGRFSSVREFCLEKVEDKGTVFLVNPAALEAIDRIIIEKIYSRIEEILTGKSLTVPPASDIRYEIQTVYCPQAKRQLIFLLEDPQRAFGIRGERRWFFRFNLEVAEFSYFLATDFLFIVPLVSPLEWIIELLSDARLAAMPPQLSIDNDERLLTFRQGRGLETAFFDDDSLRLIDNIVRRHLEISRTVDAFSQQPASRDRWLKMVETIIRVYGDE